MRTNRNRNGNDRDERGRFASNEGYSNRNGRRSYRNDGAYSNGYSGADSERYPISRVYDDYDDEYSNRSGSDHREWNSKGFSQFDRSNNEDFRSRNQRYGGNSGMYGSDNDDYRSQNRRSSGAYGSDYNSGSGSSYNRSDSNDYLGNERRNRSYQSSMSGNNGFGEYDIDHEERDNRNSSLYGRNRSEGTHRGKGPKGYTRSDERIREDINDRLSDDDNLDASEIEVEVRKGEVTLTGTVSERSDKRRAEDVAETVPGVLNVENRIRVSRSNSSEPGASSNSSSRDTSSKTSGNKSNERSKIHESVA